MRSILAFPMRTWSRTSETATGEIVPTATVFLTNRECPWRCLMCDLWRNTTIETVPAGAISGQIDYALGTPAECAANETV